MLKAVTGQAASTDTAGVVQAAVPEVKLGGMKFVLAAIVALVSPWLWGITLIAWPILAHVLPRRVDDEGDESRRWAPAFLLAFVLGYVVSYVMVLTGIYILESLSGLAVLL